MTFDRVSLGKENKKLPKRVDWAESSTQEDKKRQVAERRIYIYIYTLNLILL